MIEGAATRVSPRRSPIRVYIDDGTHRRATQNLTAKQLLYCVRDTHAKCVRGDPVDMFDSAEWPSTCARPDDSASRSGGEVIGRTDATTAEHGP